MSIYTRYFRVTSGPLMEKARELSAANEVARLAVIAFCKEIGAVDVLSHRDGRWEGFKFAATPDQAVWKQPNSFGTYWPRKNTAGGRDMLERIEALSRIVHIEAALEQVGLTPGVPALVYGNRWSAPSLTGVTKLGVLFAIVPWRDIDPAEIAAYKFDRAAARRLSMELDHLCWEPTADMVELKRWEVEKEIEELNAMSRAERGGAA